MSPQHNPGPSRHRRAARLSVAIGTAALLAVLIVAGARSSDASGLAVTAGPVTDLIDGTTISVSVQGLDPARDTIVAQCVTGPELPAAGVCARPVVVSPSAAGTAKLSITGRTGPVAGHPGASCPPANRHDRCVLRVSQGTVAQVVRLAGTATEGDPVGELEQEIGVTFRDATEVGGEQTERPRQVDSTTSTTSTSAPAPPPATVLAETP